MSTLRVTNLKGGSAGSAPNLPDGAVITGVATVGVLSATTFYGSGANLTGIDATALKDGGGTVKVQANSDGAVVTGVLTATTGSFTGNISVGGTLTYEDVTNVDSVGLITARNGVNISGSDLKVGAAFTVGQAGVVTATSFVGDGANLTNLPPAGNTFTGIASGAIANNKPVCVTLDGKMMQVAGNFVPKSPPTTSAAWAGNGAANYNMGALWNSTDEQILLGHTINGNQMKIYNYQTNTSTGNLTHLGTTTINSVNSSRGYSSYTYDPVNNKMVAFTTANSGGALYFNILTPTNNAYTNNNGFITLNSSTSTACCYEPTQGKVVLLRRDTSTYLWGSVGEVSGTSITMGSEVRPEVTGTLDGSFDVISIGNGKVLAAYNDAGNNYMRVVVGTLDSGGANTITWGTHLVQPNTNQNIWLKLGYDPGTGQAVIFYKNVGGSGTLCARGITISGTTPSFGSQIVVNNTANSDAFGAAYHKKSGAMWIFYFFNGNSGEIRGKEVIYPSAGSLSFGTEFTVGGNDSQGMMTGVAAWNHPSDSTKNYDFITNYAWRSGADNVQYTTNVVTTLTNMNNQQSYVGFANQAYTDGQTATIKSYGNNVSTLSGLTTGSVYYVTATGDISLSAATFGTGTFLSGTPVAGTALNATTLLIRDPTTRTT